MGSHNRTLLLLASKLGLDREEKVISKAAEYERLLQTKSIAGNNISDTSKVVICLDLAAGILGADLDLKTSIKYSGLKPSTYTNTKKVLQNLLELGSDKLTTSVLCAALQCSGVQELADRVLDEYRKVAKVEIDLHLPQYVCMAVYHACRLNKVKISKSKIIERSRLKPTQWSKLDADWTKFVDLHFTAVKKKKGKAVKNAIEIPEEMEIDIPQKEEADHHYIEPYEDWKRRILEAAYKELKELEQCESRGIPKDTPPRRSPRKTPLKYAPYDKPPAGRGVRLLFPHDL